jgi:deoxyhypusine synthase
LSLLQISKREEPLPSDKIEEVREDSDLFTVRRNNCTIFLGYTSNMASCGVRDTIRFLVQHKMVGFQRKPLI